MLPHWHSYIRIFLPLAESSMARMNFGSLPHFPQRGGESGLTSTAAFSIFLILGPTHQPGRRESEEPVAGSRRGLPGTRPTALDLGPGAAAGLRGPRSTSDRARRNN